ncbi:hypothetical protein B0H19DRAFT_1065408 [Mycena capillaripes]|nr:hypothetical protein B0H19DRAFT_1065408 [Mycena capillaripes]
MSKMAEGKTTDEQLKLSHLENREETPVPQGRLNVVLLARLGLSWMTRCLRERKRAKRKGLGFNSNGSTMELIVAEAEALGCHVTLEACAMLFFHRNYDEPGEFFALEKNYSFGNFRLSDPPGLETVLEGTAKAVFHPHPVCVLRMRNVELCDNAKREVVDLRLADYELRATSTRVAKAVAIRDWTVSLEKHDSAAYAINRETGEIAMNNVPGLRFKGTAGLLMCQNGGSDSDEKHDYELEGVRSDISTIFEATCLVKELHVDQSGPSLTDDDGPVLSGTPT